MKKTKIFNVAYKIIATILVLDLLAFTLWVASGQVPPTEYFAGAITANLFGLML